MVPAPCPHLLLCLLVTGLWDSAGARESGCHSLCLRRVDSFTADIKLICCEVWASASRGLLVTVLSATWAVAQQTQRSCYSSCALFTSHTHSHTKSHRLKSNTFAPACFLGVSSGSRSACTSKEFSDTIKRLPNYTTLTPSAMKAIWVRAWEIKLWCVFEHPHRLKICVLIERL